MKKAIKSLKYLIITLIVASLVITKLIANKKQNKEETQLASIQAKALPVNVDTISFSTMVTEINTYGTVENKTDLMLMAEAQGLITDILKTKGDWLKKGDPIIIVESDVLKAKQDLALANYKTAQIDYERIQRLVEKNAATKKQLENAQLNLYKTSSDYKTITKNLANTKVESPVDGYITDSYVEKGELLSGGRKICNIISPNDLLIKATVTGKESTLIAKGDTVDIQTDVYPNEVFKGTISNISLKASSTNRYTIEIKLARDVKLKAGMYATVSLIKKKDIAIKVPRTAISGTLKDASVFTVANNQAQEKKVKVGNTQGDIVEIVSGLAEGDVIVTSGNINIYDQAFIRIIN